MKNIDKLSDQEILDLAQKLKINTKTWSENHEIEWYDFDGKTLKDLYQYLSQYPEESEIDFHVADGDLYLGITEKKQLTIPEIKEEIKKYYERQKKIKEDSEKLKKEREAEELKIYEKWKKKLEKN